MCSSGKPYSIFELIKHLETMQWASSVDASAHYMHSILKLMQLNIRLCWWDRTGLDLELCLCRIWKSCLGGLVSMGWSQWNYIQFQSIDILYTQWKTKRIKKHGAIASCINM